MGKRSRKRNRSGSREICTEGEEKQRKEEEKKRNMGRRRKETIREAKEGKGEKGGRDAEGGR